VRDLGECAREFGCIIQATVVNPLGRWALPATHFVSFVFRWFFLSIVHCELKIVHWSFVVRPLSFVTLCGMLLIGCNVFVPPDAGLGNMGVDTAAAAVERASPPEPGVRRVYATKFMPNAALVVFREIGGETPFSVGYGYLSRVGMDWQMHEVSMHGSAAPPANVGPIYLNFSMNREMPGHTIVVGSLLDERVSFVEAAFANGQIKTDAVVNGLTGIFVERGTALCRLKLLDSQNNALFDLELTKNPVELELEPDIVEWAKKECV